MRYFLFLLFPAGLLLASDSPISLEIGLVHARYEGARHFGAKSFGGSDGPDFDFNKEVPYVSIAAELADHWSLGVTYLDHGREELADISPDSDVFGNGEWAFPVLTPYQISQEIEEVAFDLSYRLELANRWAVDFGPVLSRVSWDSTVAGIRFRDTDTRFGALIELATDLSADWSINARYRRLAVTELDADLLSLGFEYSF